jgi:molybdate transport system substrate-binding protein
VDLGVASANTLLVRRLLPAAVALVLASACHKTPPAPQPGPLTVAAASDLAFAFKDVGAAFEKKTGTPVTFSFGATGLLEKQIAEGAPFDLFAAANVTFVDDAVKSGACLADTKATYATGHLVMWTKKGSPLPKAPADLAHDEFRKIAIANPEHAPYGKAAKQALERSGVWSAVQPKLVFGENVQQTLQFAQSGNVEVAIVGLSLALVSDGDYAPIAESAYDRLDQALVVCDGGAATQGAHIPAAKSFAAFVSSDEGRTIMRKYGFLLPGESMAKATP